VTAVLAIVLDSATPAVTAALVSVGAGGGITLHAQRVTVDARAHGELLAPQLDAVLREAGAGLREVAAIVAGLGPGPFTGLRVGLVTAAALGDTLGVPTYGVCSLDGLGSAIAEPDRSTDRSAGRLLVATDARRREIYWAVYEEGVRIGEPAVDRPAAVAARAAEFGLREAVGDGAYAYADLLGLPVRAQPRYPVATALAGVAAARVLAGAPSEALTPLYLRRPDAVEPAARKAVLR
jgi:tRNA threonylcarbamoyl adenosine modification protein YeaZ